MTNNILFFDDDPEIRAYLMYEIMLKGSFELNPVQDDDRNMLNRCSSVHYDILFSYTRDFCKVRMA